MAAKRSKGETTLKAIPRERSHFNLLLASNPNYFSNLEGSPFKGVLKQSGDTTYEQVECAGLNPQLDLLEAVVRIKQNYGYSGEICSPGSLEYVRFYADYSNTNTWTDLGFATIRVHDTPGKPKPICYTAKLAIDPPRKWCFFPYIVKIRAILSWNALPPANTPNYPPVWGNVLDVNVQIRPTLRRPWLEVFDELKTVKIPKDLQVALSAVDASTQLTFTPKALSLAELRELYKEEKVPVHRYASSELHALAQKPAILADAKISESPLSSIPKKDILEIIDGFLKPPGNTTYEEVRCVGLRPEDDTVGAIVTIKRPTGYLGGLCNQGSVEYVAFWLDAGSGFESLGTSGVQVHDLFSTPAGGVQYAVYLPVDLSKYLQSCRAGALVGRLRAVLQWNTPPSTTNPDAPVYWGNRSECHVQLRPGDGLVPTLLDISNVPADDAGINQSTGLTRAFDAPFGGAVAIRAIMGGYPNPPRQYKIEVQKDGELTWRTLTNDIDVRVFRFDTGTGNVVDCDPLMPGFQVECVEHLSPTAGLDPGWYTYLNATNGTTRTVLVDNTIGYWHTGPNEEGKWRIRASFRDNAMSPHVFTQEVVVRIDNTAPRVHAELAVSTDPQHQCGKFVRGDVISGTYTCDDRGSNPSVPDPTLSEFQHFYAITAYTLPSGLIAAPVSLDGDGSTRVLGNMGGSGGFSLTTVSGDRPCGYVIVFVVSDRTIYGYASTAGAFTTTNLSGSYELGFCLD